MKMLERLEHLLDRIRKGDKDENLRKEAQKLLNSVDILAEVRPEELQVMKQDFLEAGLIPNKLECCCSSHHENKGNLTHELRAGLPQDHMIISFLEQHQQLLNLLDQLTVHNHSIQAESSYYKAKDELDKIFELVNKLVARQVFHQKEDNFIYKEIEKKLNCELPALLKREASDIYSYVSEIKNFVSAANEKNFSDYKKEINISLQLLDSLLREHIYKENNILYPQALEVLDKKAWFRLSKR